MRDLLYLSESKMRALVPQLPGQLRRRLGLGAGFNAGVVTVKASLPGQSQPASIALLDAVVQMIEQERGSRWRTDSDLRAGDWIQFDEELRYGSAETTSYLDRDDQAGQRALAGLVYFATTGGDAPFVLCGSSVHVLDRWQPADAPDARVGYFYLDAIIAYARQLAEAPDEAAATEVTPPAEIPSPRSLGYALWYLCADPRTDGLNHWAGGPVRLSGHARVLAVTPGYAAADPPAVLATPLYVAYAQRD